MVNVEDYLEGALEKEKPIRKYEWCPIVCKNGAFVNVSESITDAYNSLLINNLGFVETIICHTNEPYMWFEHYGNIKQSIKALSFNAESFLSSEDLRRKIEIFISKNHYPSYSRIHLFVWQSLDSNQIEWLMTQEKLHNCPYDFSKTSYIIGVYNESLLARLPNPWINVPTVVNVLAEKWSKNQGYDAACLVNYENKIVSTTQGSIYIIKNMNIIGVNPMYGTHQDAIESTIALLSVKLGMNMKYIDGLTLDILYDADEIMIASASNGVKCVVGIEQKRYSKNITEKIALLISEHFVGA